MGQFFSQRTLLVLKFPEFSTRSNKRAQTSNKCAQTNSFWPPPLVKIKPQVLHFYRERENENPSPSSFGLLVCHHRVCVPRSITLPLPLIITAVHSSHPGCLESWGYTPSFCHLLVRSQSSLLKQCLVSTLAACVRARSFQVWPRTTHLIAVLGLFIVTQIFRTQKTDMALNGYLLSQTQMNAVGRRKRLSWAARTEGKKSI